MSRNDEASTHGAANRRRFLKAVGALGVVGLAGCGGDGDDETATETPTDTEGMETTTAPDTATATATDTATATATDTATPTATPSEEIPDPPADLFSFAEDTRQASAGETLTVEGTITNAYLFDVRNVEVTLEGPSDDWNVSATGDTQFDTIESQESVNTGWEVAVPESAESDAELTAMVSYESATDEASVELTSSVSVIPPAPDVTAPITDGLAGQIDAAQLSETDSLSLWQAVNAEGRTGTLSQSDGDAQPSVVADASPTGESVARFEGDGDFMATSGPLTEATAGVTMVAAFRVDNTEKLRQVVAFNGSDDAGNGYGIIINSEADGQGVDGSVDLLYGGVNWWYSDLTIDDDAIHVASMVIPSDDPASPQLFVDGQEASFRLQGGGGADVPGTPSSQYGIGQDEVTVDQPPYLDGDVGEQLVYERELSQAEREDVESYLVDKWVGGE
jgi:hypothetical protein